MDEVNIRSYASAEWDLYSHDSAVLERLAALAEREPDRVAAARQRGPVLHLLEKDEGEENRFHALNLYRPRAAVPRGRQRRDPAA